MEGDAGAQWIVLGVIAAVCAGCLLFYIVRKRQERSRLYRLEKSLEELKRCDAYADFFVRNARMFQVLIGIDREYGRDDIFLERLKTEFLSTVGMKDFTAEGFRVLPARAEGEEKDSAAQERKLSLRELEDRKDKAEQGIRARRNRAAFKQALEETGKPAGQIVREARRGFEREDAAEETRSRIRRICAALCAAGIYPMFYQDFQENPERQEEFETVDFYSTEYPGLYERAGEDYRLITNCWGRRKGTGA